MARVNNPRKQFQFNVIIPGLNPFLVQVAKTPDTEFDTAEHGDVGRIIKTAGLIKYTVLNIQKIQESSGASVDKFIWLWMRTIRNNITGGGALPSVYKKPIIVEQYGNDGITVVQRWIYQGCWPKRVNGMDFSRVSSENSVENIDFEIDDCEPLA